MNYELHKPLKPLNKIVKGLAYTALTAGIALHTLEFVGGLVLFNQIESGGVKVTLNDEGRARGINNSKDAATYLADKTISEIKEPLEYFFLAGFKGAALSYKNSN